MRLMPIRKFCFFTVAVQVRKQNKFPHYPTNMIAVCCLKRFKKGDQKSQTRCFWPWTKLIKLLRERRLFNLVGEGIFK